MRYLLALTVVLAACHGARDQGPAWPKRADRDLDGGESIAPRVARSSVASSPDEAIVEDKPAVAVEKKDVPLGDTSKPSVTPATPPNDDSLFGEEMTIEVDD